MRFVNKVSTSAIALLSASATAPAFASIDEIIVTAQLREQSILEVPIAVTAYDGEFLRDIGVDEFDQLSAFVPGFVVQEQSVNNPGFVLRGITSDSGASNIEPRVSVFQNGVSIARSRGSIVQLFDIERVEVLKGPQGTLFGRSAQIGAVNVITKKPEDEFGAGVQVEFGNFDQQYYDGFINIPVSDKVGFRAAAVYNRRNGFIDNNTGLDLNSTDTLAIRGSLRFEPTESITIDIIGNYSKDDPSGSSFKSGVVPALGGSTNPNDFASLNNFGDFFPGGLSIDREIYDVTAIISADLSDSWTLTSTTGYRQFDSLEVFDPDGTAFDIFIFAEDAEAEQVSTDIRFNFDDGDRLQAFFGAGIFFEEGSQRVPLGIDLATTGAFFGSLAAQGDPVNGVAPFAGNPALTAAFLTGDPAVLNALLALGTTPPGLTQLEEFTNFSDNTSYDFFGEVTYEVLPKVELTVGGRYTRDDKETLFTSSVAEFAPFSPGPILVGDSGGILSSDSDPTVGSTFDGFAWRAVLNWEFQDNRYVYFNYSRGRRPEVIQDDFDPNGAGGVTGGFEVIPAETVNSYEIGTKGSYFDSKLTVEAAAYYYGYQNFQTQIAVGSVGGGAPTFELINGGNADSIGAEIALDYQPMEDLNVFFTYGFNRGRFDEVDSNGNEQEFGGNQFRLSPDHALSVGFNYQRNVGPGRLFIIPTYTFKSNVFFEDANDEAFTVVDGGGNTVFEVPGVNQESFGLLNLRGGVRLLEGSLIVEGYAENLLDKEFIVDAGNTGGSFGIPTFIAGNPRFFGGGIRYRY